MKRMLPALCKLLLVLTVVSYGFQGTKDVVLPVVLGVCLLLIVLLLGTCCLSKKEQKQTKTSQRSADDRREDIQELVYCQVKKKQEQDPQVAYEGWSPLLQTNVAYTQIPTVDRDK